MSWTQYSLGDLGTFFGGVTSVSKDDYGWGTPFLTYKNVFSNSKVDVSELALMNVKAADLQKRSCVYGDIFFTASSETPNEVAMSSVLLDDVDELTFNGFTKRFRLHDFDTLLPGFARYLFRGNGFRDAAYEAATGDVRFNISQESLSRISVLLPSIDEQRGIALTLGALDDKIESNCRVIALVPELIRAEVRAALDGACDSIPVSKLAKFVNGGAYTKNATGKGRMVIRIADLNSGPGPSTVYNELQVPEDKTARPGDILMSWSGSLGVYRWFRDEAIVNQHIFKVLPTDYPDWLVFDRLDHVIEVFQGIAKDKATTMGHIQRGHLESTSVDVPNGDDIKTLDARLGPLWSRLLAAEQETLLLESLRDVLAQELLSGRVRVPEAQGAVA